MRDGVSGWQGSYLMTGKTRASLHFHNLNYLQPINFFVFCTGFTKVQVCINLHC